MFEVWKTICVRGQMSAKDYLSMSIGDVARQMLISTIDEHNKDEEVELVNTSAAELGLVGVVTRGQLYERAQERGLLLCPNHIGPWLCLGYKDQPRGEVLFVGMNPVSCSGGKHRVYTVESARLLSDNAHPDVQIDINARWLFKKKK